MNVGLKVRKTTRLLIIFHVLCNTENTVFYSKLIPTLLCTVSGVRRSYTLYKQFFFFLTTFLHRQYHSQEIPSNVYACQLLLPIFMTVELRLYTYIQTLRTEFMYFIIEANFSMQCYGSQSKTLRVWLPLCQGPQGPQGPVGFPGPKGPPVSIFLVKYLQQHGCYFSYSISEVSI